MQSIKRLAIAAAAVLSVLVPTAGPADAAAGLTATFSGTMVFPPFGEPGLSAPQSGGLTLNSSVCVQAEGGTASQAGFCSLALSGAVGPNLAGLGAYCGIWGATVNGVVSLASGHHKVWLVLENSRGVIDVKGTALKIDTGESGPIVGTLTESPTSIGQGSCLTNTHTATTVNGTLSGFVY